MPNANKIKGTQFEREAVNLLTSLIKDSEWKRIPTSGAIGTKMGVPILFSDMIGRIRHFTKKFRGEAKVGYGGAKQFTLKKEWLDKVIEESKSTYSVPFLIGKFLGSRDGTRIFVVLDIDTFAYLLNTITDTQQRLNDEVEKDTEALI